MLIRNKDAAMVELVERLRSRDRSAFDELVRAYWDPIYRYFWKRVRASDCADLTQTVFVSFYRAVQKGNGPKTAKPKTWRRYLFAIAQNLVTDHYRRMSVRPPAIRLDDLLSEEVALLNPSRIKALELKPAPDPLVSGEQATALRDCLGRLNVLPRAICWLHFVDGLSKREIARSLGMPESTLREVVARALKELRGCLEGKGVASDL